MSTAPAEVTAPLPDDTAADSPAQQNIFRRILQGDLASVRVIFGLIVIWAIFQIANDHFLTAINLTNLFLQITAVGLISVGVVFVLLLGEIDLSIGAVSGLCAAIVAVLNVKHGWAPIPAIAVGHHRRHGHRVRPGRAVHRLRDPVVRRHAGRTPRVAGRPAVGPRRHRHDQRHRQHARRPGEHLLLLHGRLDRRGAGDRALRGDEHIPVRAAQYGRAGRGQDIVPIIVRIVLVAAAIIAAIAILNSNRGLPLAIIVLIAFVAGGEYVATRTAFGRHIFAVGGNAEAARRAGISVHRIRIAVFAISGTMSAIGGIFAASRLLAVNQSSGGSDLLLLAIAGPVIAGTSLFGGRGSVWSALLGALVIGSISNGMDLLALDSSVKFMVTGAVLLAAVIVDALARRSRQAAGRV